MNELTSEHRKRVNTLNHEHVLDEQQYDYGNQSSI